ncbi:putative nucleotide-binding alpha-beta plait domain superfamily, RNA-binding domain superfamily [Helianthus anomalus]
MKLLSIFKDYKFVEEKVLIARRPDGKVSREAYVTFETTKMAKQELCKDRLMIGSCYVELFSSTPDEARRAESRSRQ